MHKQRVVKQDRLRKKRSISDFARNERGAIAIMFVLMGGFLLGMAALGFEGSRFLIERARLSDAMEQAALALAAEDNGNQTPEAVARNRVLATLYLGSYMRNDKSVSAPAISVSDVISVPHSNDSVQYVEYRLNAVTEHDAWFSSSYFPSFQSTVYVGDNGAARKYRANIDVVFAVDFSNSMNGELSGGGSKVEELKRIVLKLSRELYSYNVTNRVGFVPFDWGIGSGGRCIMPISTNTRLDEIPGAVVDTFENYIDYAETLNAIPGEPANSVNAIAVEHWACLKSTNAHEVLLTDRYDEISQISDMVAYGNTFISPGILRAAQLLSHSRAAKRVIVIVSDGEDHPNIQPTINLINGGMCDRIKASMATRYSAGKIAFVGVGYKPSTDWTACVGKNNFFVSESVDELEKDLRRAVFEEVGHNTLKVF
ncbi:TadE/TadG family type IV pilus assembly protein [Leminorella grimontii]|uniref:TadE/TadG family type IV pilus assembly protein n=1 Tax=Leminorella grimontii TaxID=82981 RepID=UPI00321FE722